MIRKIEAKRPSEHTEESNNFSVAKTLVKNPITSMIEGLALANDAIKFETEKRDYDSMNCKRFQVAPSPQRPKNTPGIARQRNRREFAVLGFAVWSRHLLQLVVAALKVRWSEQHQHNKRER